MVGVAVGVAVVVAVGVAVVVAVAVVVGVGVAVVVVVRNGRCTVTAIPHNDTSSESVPYESIPALVANSAFITKMDRLRELRAMKDALFNSDEKKGPLGEYEALKRECAAMALVHGARSVTYIDLRVMHAAGGSDKGKVSGQEVINELVLHYGIDPRPEHFRAIALAAKECDPQILMNGGISPSVIAAAKTPDKPRADSVRVEWVGAKGKGAAGRRGDGGAVQ